MYDFLLILHSWLRWALVITALIAIYRAFNGWTSKRPYTNGDNKSSLFFMIAADLQLLVGLLLYFVYSPITTNAMKSMGDAMKSPALRFWTVEHTSMMLIALILIHIGRSSSKKATIDLQKHKRAAIFFTIALVLMLIAVPWEFMANSRPYFRY